MLSCSSFRLTSESESATAVSELIFLIISLGVFDGAKNANHVDTSYPGNASDTVGSSGAKGNLLALVTASPRTWLALTTSIAAPRLRNPASIRSEIRSVNRKG